MRSCPNPKRPAALGWRARCRSSVTARAHKRELLFFIAYALLQKHRGHVYNAACELFGIDRGAINPSQRGCLMCRARDSRTIITIHGIVASLCICFVLLCGLAHAQVTTGDILGTVTDPTGAVLPNVTVVIANTGTHETRSTTSNSGGRSQPHAERGRPPPAEYSHAGRGEYRAGGSKQHARRT